MRYFIKAIAALALVAALATGLGGPASADARADYAAANAATRANNFNEAIRLYTKVIVSGELSGNNLAFIYNNRGFVYDEKRQYSRALADYDRAINLNPNYTKAYNNRGVTYKNLRKYDRAIADYVRAIALNPNYGAAYFNRGIAYEQKGRKNLAIADYRRAARILPNSSVVHRALKRLGATP